jgi:hypothetical protein
MKSRTNSALAVVPRLSPLNVLESDGPAPNMNSSVADRRYGFLDKKSADSSVWAAVARLPFTGAVDLQYYGVILLAGILRARGNRTKHTRYDNGGHP